MLQFVNHKKTWLPLFLIATCYGLFGQAAVKPQPYFSDPAISPDASEIVFVSGGDLWTMPVNGTVANLLLSHPSYESRPVYSPDGRSLAFISTRTGNGDIYILNLASGKLDRLTFDDAPDELSAWSADGYIYFSSVSKDIAGMKDIFRVKATGGTPMAISKEKYVAEYFGMPSPDGKTMAFSARGVASAQWWRNGRSHIDESEIWLLQTAQGKYEKVTPAGAKHLWPMWASDGKSLFYVSDKSGKENLYLQPINGTAKQLTNFGSGRMLWPSIAANGKAIVFERDFNIWYYDVASAKAKELNIIRRGVPASTVPEHKVQSNEFRGLSLSPDGKKVVFVARGDLFLSAAKDGGDAKRLTNTAATEGNVAWANNSNSIVYTANRDEATHIYQYNFLTNKETQLTFGKEDDLAPEFSPDGKFLAFLRSGKEIRKLNMQTKAETLVTTAYLGLPLFASSSTYSWSPDGRWIAYIALQDKAFENLHIVSANGGKGKAVSFLANSNSDDVSWSKNGKYIMYNTNQRTENRTIARVDLVKQIPKFKEEQIQKMFTDPMQPASPAPTPSTNTTKPPAVSDSLFKSSSKTEKDTTVINWDGIAQRLNILPLGIDVSEFQVSPDGNTLALISSVAGQQNIFTYSLDELSKDAAVLKQLTTTASAKNSLQFNSDGKDIYFMEQGRIQSVSLDSKQTKSISVTAEFDIDFEKEKLEVFKQAWELQNKGFYDPEFHGANWNTVKKNYEPLVAGAATAEEMRRLLSLMVGELNASHLGVSGPQAGFTLGRAGLLFDRVEYENKGNFKITDVLGMGPAALGGNVQVGDYLISIDGTVLNATSNIDELLNNKIGKMVTLAIAKQPNGIPKDVSVRAVNLMTEKNLIYKQWVQEQKAYVNRISKGRLGYVHMLDMSSESLNQLHIDMDADNHSREGVVVDVRNNNGGFVNGYALDVLSRKGYLNMTTRGMPTAPGRVQLGQRALDAPTILVTNQHSLSDAEDFTEGYRALKLGKVVGEATAGWIIFTTNITLFDGTTVRLPFIRITDLQGKDMELNPRPVDIEVSNPLGQNGNDNQLDTAVKELLKQIDGGK